jgi:hypothetical protein
VKIFKILSPEEFLRICLIFEADMEEDNKKYGHLYGSLDVNRLQDIVYSDSADLVFSLFHIWAVFDGQTPLSFIVFSEIFQLFGCNKVCSEVHWISRDKKSGLILLKNSLKELKEMGFDYVMLSSVENHPVSEKLRNLYPKLGFQKESETYIKKL